MTKYYCILTISFSTCRESVKTDIHRIIFGFCRIYWVNWVRVVIFIIQSLSFVEGAIF